MNPDNEPIRIMLDTETMGLGRDAKVTAVGAMRFCPAENRLWGGIEFAVDDPTGAVTPSTAEWWARDEMADAREYLTALHERSAASVMGDLRAYATSFAYETTRAEYGVEWWAKSPNFDMAILEDMHERAWANKPVHVPGAPWHFRNLRDVRTTLAGVSPDFNFGSPAIEAPAHSPLADCEYQARQVMEVLRFTRRIN